MKKSRVFSDLYKSTNSFNSSKNVFKLINPFRSLLNFISPSKLKNLPKLEKRYSTAFSTMELLVTMCLMGLIFSISSIYYPTSNIHYYTSIDCLKSDLRYVISLAQDNNITYKFILDDDNKSYKIISRSGKIHIKRNLEKYIYLGYLEQSFSIGNLNRSGGSPNPLSLYIVDSSRHKAQRITIMLATSRVHSYDCSYKPAILELFPKTQIGINNEENHEK